MDTIANLGWNGIFDAADLLYGTVEIISVAHYDAHYKLYIWLKQRASQQWQITQNQSHNHKSIHLKCKGRIRRSIYLIVPVKQATEEEKSSCEVWVLSQDWPIGGSITTQRGLWAAAGFLLTHKYRKSKLFSILVCWAYWYTHMELLSTQIRFCQILQRIKITLIWSIPLINDTTCILQVQRLVVLIALDWQSFNSCQLNKANHYVAPCLWGESECSSHMSRCDRLSAPPTRASPFEHQ